MGAMTWRKTGVYVLLVLPILGLAGIAVAAKHQDASQQQTGDPVADAARKAREQKKNAAQPKKVFTNDDVAPAPPPAPTATPTLRRNPLLPGTRRTTRLPIIARRDGANVLPTNGRRLARLSRNSTFCSAKRRSSRRSITVIRRRRLPSNIRAKTSPIRTPRSRRRKTKSPS